MGPPLNERPEPVGGVLGPAGAAESLAMPEEEITLEPRWDAPARQLRPHLLGLRPATQSVEREGQAVTAPGVEQRRMPLAEQPSEGALGAGRVAEPERGPAAAMHRPRPVLAAGRVLGRLPEAPVGVGHSTEQVERLGVPVAGLGPDLRVGAGARGVLQCAAGVFQLPLEQSGPPALEGLRGKHLEPRPHAGQRARRRQRSQRPGRRRDDNRRRRHDGGVERRGRQGDPRRLDHRLVERRRHPGDQW
jgi:hypothetical protein